MRGAPSWTGAEGVKYAGPILLSQQQYVKVQGFTAADTVQNPFPLATLVTYKILRTFFLTLTLHPTNLSNNTGTARNWLLASVLPHMHNDITDTVVQRPRVHMHAN